MDKLNLITTGLVALAATVEEGKKAHAEEVSRLKADNVKVTEALAASRAETEAVEAVVKQKDTLIAEYEAKISAMQEAMEALSKAVSR